MLANFALVGLELVGIALADTGLHNCINTGFLVITPNLEDFAASSYCRMRMLC